MAVRITLYYPSAPVPDVLGSGSDVEALRPAHRVPFR